MRSKKTILALLLVAALAIGVGYASLADKLLIDASIDYDLDQANVELDEDVLFVDAVAIKGCQAHVNASNHDNAKILIGGDNSEELAAPGQFAIAKFKVENRYESPVKIEAQATIGGTATGEYQVTVKYGEDGTQSELLIDSTENDDYGWIYITVTPTRVITNPITDGTLEITFDATPVVAP